MWRSVFCLRTLINQPGRLCPLGKTGSRCELDDACATQPRHSTVQSSTNGVNCDVDINEYELEVIVLCSRCAQKMLQDFRNRPG